MGIDKTDPAYYTPVDAMGKRAAARGGRRCGWPARACRGAEVTRSTNDSTVYSTHRFRCLRREAVREVHADGVGRPSLAPGRYFRLLLGYFEDLDSEQVIAWRAADSLSLLQFLDVALHEAPPDHSTGVAHATAGRLGDAPGSLHVGVAAAGRRRLGQRQDPRHRRDDAGSDRGVAEHRSPGHG